MLATAFGQVFLRINSIELGLKHIINRELGKFPPHIHDLVKLWECLTDDWREKLVKCSGISEADIRKTLEDHKLASVAVRFGGNFGATPPGAEMIRKEASVLEKLANTIGGSAHPPIQVKEFSQEN